ncbi:MAG: 30S ribosomal protein S11 [Candidatus Paceibacterota bacterium]|jgi:small subunit ribosomal protein S11
MGKLRIVKKVEEEIVEGPKDQTVSDTEVKATSVKIPKKKITSGILHVEATFNNTKAVFTDKQGNSLFSSSSGALGFKGAKKGTPFAASKVGDVVGEKAQILGIKDADVFIKGVGSGREPTVRAFMARGIELTSVKDITPVPHNGPKPKKPRRV